VKGETGGCGDQRENGDAARKEVEDPGHVCKLRRIAMGAPSVGTTGL
jgi:hypothetical protein